MYLKSLTLKGFKSFADRAHMTFEPGLTVIVGPNGSGKSNISDAILWVLGEQSAKQLRGQAMEDVIFSGSSARKPVSVAEVTLVLDNADHVLPVDFDEVAITRRMYRSGESEYLINQSPCRLMDIQDILHDSGLGKDTHSIISQGKLDSILQSRPEERRALIERKACEHDLVGHRAHLVPARHRLDPLLGKLDGTAPTVLPGDQAHEPRAAERIEHARDGGGVDGEIARDVALGARAVHGEIRQDTGLPRTKSEFRQVRMVARPHEMEHHADLHVKISEGKPEWKRFRYLFFHEHAPFDIPIVDISSIARSRVAVHHGCGGLGGALCTPRRSDGFCGKRGRNMHVDSDEL